MLAQLPPETFDLNLTDPLYLVSYSGRRGSDAEPVEGVSDPNWVEPIYREIGAS